MSDTVFNLLIWSASFVIGYVIGEGIVVAIVCFVERKKGGEE